MFAHLFQTGESGIEVLTASGKSPGKEWKISGGVHRVYDRNIKGFVFLMEKGMNTTMECPAKSADTLGLLQSFIIFQLRRFQDKPLSIELTILDNKGNRRRLHFSTKFRDIVCNDLHSQIPLQFNEPDKWCNLIFNIKDLTSTLFTSYKYFTIDTISITPACRIRKIFTLPTLDSNLISIPEIFQFPLATEFTTQMFNLYFQPERNVEQENLSVIAVAISSHAARPVSGIRSNSTSTKSGHSHPAKSISSSSSSVSSKKTPIIRKKSEVVTTVSKKHSAIATKRIEEEDKEEDKEEVKEEDKGEEELPPPRYEEDRDEHGGCRRDGTALVTAVEESDNDNDDNDNDNDLDRGSERDRDSDRIQSQYNFAETDDIHENRHVEVCDVSNSTTTTIDIVKRYDDDDEGVGVGEKATSAKVGKFAASLLQKKSGAIATGTGTASRRRRQEQVRGLEPSADNMTTTPTVDEKNKEMVLEMEYTQLAMRPTAVPTSSSSNSRTAARTSVSPSHSPSPLPLPAAPNRTTIAMTPMTTAAGPVAVAVAVQSPLRAHYDAAVRMLTKQPSPRPLSLPPSPLPSPSPPSYSSTLSTGTNIRQLQLQHQVFSPNPHHSLKINSSQSVLHLQLDTNTNNTNDTMTNNTDTIENNMTSTTTTTSSPSNRDEDDMDRDDDMVVRDSRHIPRPIENYKPSSSYHHPVMMVTTTTTSINNNDSTSYEQQQHQQQHQASKTTDRSFMSSLSTEKFPVVISSDAISLDHTQRSSSSTSVRCKTSTSSTSTGINTNTIITSNKNEFKITPPNITTTKNEEEKYTVENKESLIIIQMQLQLEHARKEVNRLEAEFIAEFGEIELHSVIGK